MACHLPELDGFDQHLQATTHFLLTSVKTSATSIIFLLKNIDNAEYQTHGCWVRSKYATSMLCSPPPSPCIIKLRYLLIKGPHLVDLDPRSRREDVLRHHRHGEVPEVRTMNLHRPDVGVSEARGKRL